MLLTHALALSANQFLFKKKCLHVCALGENRTHEINFSRNEDNLPSHGGYGSRQCPSMMDTVVVVVVFVVFFVPSDISSTPSVLPDS